MEHVVLIMHPYATDSLERKYIPFLLAVLAVLAAWGLSRILATANLTVPWWLDAPSAIGFYGILYALFDYRLWRLGIFRRLRAVQVPDLEGNWRGGVTSSFDEHATEHKVEVRIAQRWTKIGIRLLGKDSRSHSVLGTILIGAPQGTVVAYQYENEPLPGAKDSMQMHHGTARLELSNDKILSGVYYSGRGRQNVGRLHLEKVVGAPPVSHVE